MPTDPSFDPAPATTAPGRALLAALSIALAVAGSPAQSSPNDALRALLTGNERFVAGRGGRVAASPGRRLSLARGQQPVAVVVTCAEGAVAPERVFDAGMGELVVVRTAGHVLGAASIEAVERAVTTLRAPLVVVLSHERCAVLRAAAGEGQGGRVLSPAGARLLARVEPALRAARAQGLEGEDALARAEEERAHETAHDCLRRSPALLAATQGGRVRLVAARLRRDGQVDVLPHRPLPQREVPAQPVLRGAAAPALPPHVALRLLRAGHRRFLTGAAATGAAGPRPAAPAGGPLAVVVTDSDARLAPELLFDVGAGELVVVRGAGGLATEEALASVELAAASLGAPLVVFLGHGRRAPDAESAAPAVVRQTVARAAADARDRSALLRACEREGRLALLGAAYDVATGDLAWVDADQAEPADRPPSTADRTERTHAPQLALAAPLAEGRSLQAAPDAPHLHATEPRPTTPRGVLVGAFAALTALLAAAWWASGPRRGAAGEAV